MAWESAKVVTGKSSSSAFMELKDMKSAQPGEIWGCKLWRSWVRMLSRASSELQVWTARLKEGAGARGVFVSRTRSPAELPPQQGGMEAS